MMLQLLKVLPRIIQEHLFIFESNCPLLKQGLMNLGSQESHFIESSLELMVVLLLEWNLKFLILPRDCFE